MSAAILRLTTQGNLTALQGRPTLAQLKRALDDDSIVAEHISSHLDVWCSISAALLPVPALNVSAMWLIQHMRGVWGIPVIFGDVLLVNRDAQGGLTPLDQVSLRLISHFLAVC